ncbi:MAG: hypothetical protein CM15mP23_17930 [Cryomorphaceae bacterium]|nr:MAG: hypothetical protein CM15mP23_17930 [Cryomorphaceae bacterium]
MTGILVGLIIAVSLIVLVQLLRVNELISQVKNEDPNLVNDQDNQTQGVLAFLIMGVLFLGSVLWQFKYWEFIFYHLQVLYMALQLIL